MRANYKVEEESFLPSLMKDNRDLWGAPNQTHANLKSWGALAFDNNQNFSQWQKASST